MNQLKTKFFIVVLLSSCLFLGNCEFTSAKIISDYMSEGQVIPDGNESVPVTENYTPENITSVENAVNYWNNVTNNTVKNNGEDYTIHFFMMDFGPGVLGISMNGIPYIGYNKVFDYDSTIPTQIDHKATNLSSIAIHEIGHQMGIVADWSNRKIEQKNGSNYMDYTFDATQGQEKWVNSIVYFDGTYKNAKGMHTAIENNNLYSSNTIIGLINAGKNFYYGGTLANEVYKDKWIKGSYDSNPALEVETGKNVSLTQIPGGAESISTGSILVHPYTRFGVMNAAQADDKRPFFSEVELAVLKETLESSTLTTGSINLKDYFGRSVYTNNNIASNATAWSSDKLYAIGLHIVGDDNTISQTANIEASGVLGTGIRVEGSRNGVIIDSGSTVSANGENGVGLLITHGGNAVVSNKGTIEATDKTGTAVYLNSGAWCSDVEYAIAGSGTFNNTGKISAKDGNAIIFDYSLSDHARLFYSGVTPDNSVSTVNIMGSSEITGDIITLNNARGVLNLGYKADSNGNKTSALDSTFKFNYNNDITGMITLNNKAGETTLNKSTINIQDLTVDVNSKILGTADITAKNTVNNGTVEANSLYVAKDSIFTGDNILSLSSTTLNSANILGSFTENKLTINNGYLNAYGNNSLTSPFIINDLTLNNASLSMINSDINSMQANKITANNANFAFDVDLAGKNIDTIKINAPVQGTINIIAYNPISDSMATSILQPIVSTDNATINTVNSAMSKILKYGITANGNNVTFNKNGYNPAALASPVAAQLGGYLIQLNSYEQGFRHMDNLMNFNFAKRLTMKDRNKYAVVDSTVVYDPNKENAVWFNPYTSFEKVKLDNGPSVNGITYGSYFGGNTDLYNLKNGWQGFYGVYGGYNGGDQYYEGVSMNENGATAGISGTLVKRNLFTGLTANVGALAGQANTMYGLDNFTMLTTGIASKTGYNFEFKDGKYMLQPNFMMGYSFINTFDYTNAAGVKITTDPLNAITIAPGVKAIMNSKGGWQPYASVSMLWNLLDKSKFNANDIPLPDMSVKPFIQYGLGIQKKWGERFTGFAQSMIRNGGRNGIALQFGFVYSLGNDPSSVGKNIKKQKRNVQKTL